MINIVEWWFHALKWVNKRENSTKSDSNIKQKSNFFKFFISFQKKDLRPTGHKIRLNFRTKHAGYSNYRGTAFSPLTSCFEFETLGFWDCFGFRYSCLELSWFCRHLAVGSPYCRVDEGWILWQSMSWAKSNGLTLRIEPAETTMLAKSIESVKSVLISG